MLDFALATRDRLTVFYNGPFCGASAPDHLHLQAVAAGKLPEEILAWRALDGQQTPGRELLSRPRLRVWMAPDRARSIIGLCGEPRAVRLGIRAAVDALSVVSGDPVEPRLNLLACARGEQLLALVIPRGAHRPACYFARGLNRCTVSPGAIDMAGLLITIRERDFLRLDAALVETIYRETSIPRHDMPLVEGLLVRRLDHV